MNEIKSNDAAPDQLLNLLEAQIALARQKRAATDPGKRTAVLVGGILLIVGGCVAALLFLQQMLPELKSEAAQDPPAEAVSVEHRKNF